MRDEQSHVSSIIVVMSDVTDAASLQAKLMHAEKMAAVGQLVSGVAEWESEHEMRRAMTTACIAVGTRAAAIRTAIRTETQTAIAMIIMTATIMTTNLTSAWADCTVPIDSN